MSVSAGIRRVSSSLRSSLRVLHATDIHFLEKPTFAEVFAGPKRVIGCTNLYVLGRANKFSRAVQMQLMDTIVAAKPDLVVISGDTTTLALEREYALARAAMQPVLESEHFPTVIIPGNHDAYTPQAVSAGLMRKYFGAWMERTDLTSLPEWQWAHSSNPSRFREQLERLQSHFVSFGSGAGSAPAPLPALPVFAFSFLRLLSLNPCRPQMIGSNGRYTQEQLAQLVTLMKQAPLPLPGDVSAWNSAAAASSSSSSASTAACSLSTASASLSSTYNILLGHYPVLDGTGHAYELQEPWHGVTNGAALRHILQHSENRVQPQMFLHGHVHKGFCDTLTLPKQAQESNRNGSSDDESTAGIASARQMLIFNPGSAGQAFSEKSRRTAAFNIYTISQGQAMEPTNHASAAVAATAAASSPAASGRVYPAPQPRPYPLDPSRPISPPHVMHSLYPMPDTATLPAVQTIVQRATDGRGPAFYVSAERWMHDGKEFVKEPFPYSTGY